MQLLKAESTRDAFLALLLATFEDPYLREVTGLFLIGSLTTETGSVVLLFAASCDFSKSWMGDCATAVAMMRVFALIAPLVRVAGVACAHFPPHTTRFRPCCSLPGGRSS